MESRTPKKVVVFKAAVKAAGVRATKASAKLEGRVVPDGHRRSAAVKAYLARASLAGGSMAEDRDNADGGDRLLDVLRREVWPLLSDHRPLTKAQREEALGYDPARGV